MFEFYRLVTDPDTKKEEIKKFQFEETPENLSLKEQLEEEKDKYERFETVIIDRYYHCDEHIETYPISLSQSVFKDDKFVGYMENDVFHIAPGSYLPTCNEVRGATSFKSYVGIRKKEEGR